MEYPLASIKPPLRYDDTCNRDRCGQRSTHRVSVRCGAGEVHFGLVVCSTCAPEIVLDDLVFHDARTAFLVIFATLGVCGVTWDGCRVHLTPLR